MSAAASEAAPAVAKWLYGTSDPKELNADQKQTIASIFGAASFVVGSKTGSTTNAIATSQLGENAVANNYLTLKQKETFSRAMRACRSDGKQDCSQITSRWANINSQQSKNLNGKNAWDLQYNYKDQAEDAIDGSIFTNFLGDDETNQLVDQWNQTDIDNMDERSPWYDEIGAYALNHPKEALSDVVGGGLAGDVGKVGLKFGLKLLVVMLENGLRRRRLDSNI